MLKYQILTHLYISKINRPTEKASFSIMLNRDWELGIRSQWTWRSHFLSKGPYLHVWAWLYLNTRLHHMASSRRLQSYELANMLGSCTKLKREAPSTRTTKIHGYLCSIHLMLNLTVSVINLFCLPHLGAHRSYEPSRVPNLAIRGSY